MAMIEYDVTAQMVKKLRGIYKHFGRRPPDIHPTFHSTESIQHFLFFLDLFDDEDDVIARQYNFDPFGLVNIEYSCRLSDDGESTNFVITLFYPRTLMGTGHICNLLRYAVQNNYIALAQKLYTHHLQPPFKNVFIRLDSDTDKLMNIHSGLNAGYFSVFNAASFSHFSEHFVRSDKYKNEFEACQALPLPTMGAEVLSKGLVSARVVSQLEYQNQELILGEVDSSVIVKTVVQSSEQVISADLSEAGAVLECY